MTSSIMQEIQALAEKFTADVAKIVRKAGKAERHANHPDEPSGASMVKVYFEGDRDGNTFAICLPTGVVKKVKRDDGSRERVQMWKYTYEQATGTAPQHRSWIGMLRTLDGHGRTATKVEIFRQSGAETIDLT